MGTVGLLMALAVVGQNGGDAAELTAPSVPVAASAPSDSPAERAAAAAEKAAVAAQKAAEAVERLATAMAPPPAPAGEDAKKAADADHWAGTVGAGLSYFTGNTETLTVTATAAADRKWDKWSLGLRAAGAFGLANPSANVSGSTSQTTARRANGTLRGDRAFGEITTLFALAGTEFDHVKNVESRTFGELGTGLTFFNMKEKVGGKDQERFFLRLDLAMRSGYETRFSYFPTPAAVDPYAIVILAPRGAVVLRWALNSHLRLSEELEVMPFLLEPTAGRLLVNSTTKLNAKLTEGVALSLALVVNHDSKPPPSASPRLNTDVALTAGVEAAF